MDERGHSPIRTVVLKSPIDSTHSAFAVGPTNGVIILYSHINQALISQIVYIQAMDYVQFKA